MPLILHSTPNNPRAAKSLIAASYNGVEITVPAGFEFGKTNKTKEFLQLNPLGKIPTLQTDDGSIWESNAIARYVARLADKGLYGRTPLEAGQVDQWLDWVRGDLEIAGAVWLYPIFGIIPNVPEATENAKQDVANALKVLNNHLLTRSYLVGERITLADIVVACTLFPFFTRLFDPNYRKPFPHVVRWFVTLVNQPNFEKHLGKVELAEKMAEAPAGGAPAAAPVAEKKPAAPAKKNDDEDDVPAEPKPKGTPIPPAKLDLEEWKRVYSNADKTSDATKWLWENYDHDVNSTWFVTYKYNDELEQTFKSLNLIGGFFQRLESFRKRGFGTLNLFGDNEKSAIHGAFLIQGKGLPFELTDCPDFPSYDFVQVDVKDDAQRKRVDDLYAWEGEYDGLKFSSGKVYK